MKKIRVFSLVMVLLLAFATLLACQPITDPDDEPIDENKTQLYVYVAKWGFGTEWFKKSKQAYEELNKDRVFEQGKKGIQISSRQPWRQSDQERYYKRSVLPRSRAVLQLLHRRAVCRHY